MNSIYFACVIMADDTKNDKSITFLDIKKMCECMPNLKYYAYILHIEPGKFNHYHLNLVFGNNGYTQHKVLYQIASMLNINVCCVQVNIASALAMYKYYRYLIHLDNPEKIQYDKSDIISNDYDIVNNCLAGINPFDLGIDTILYMVKISKNKAELYSKLGMKFSNQYYKIINDLRNMKSSL